MWPISSDPSRKLSLKFYLPKKLNWCIINNQPDLDLLH